LNLLLLGAICCDITNGYDGSMLNGLQILPQWQEFFGHPTSSTLGLISNGTRIGQAGAIIAIAPIIQKFGRRWPIVFGSAFLLIGIALQTAAQNLSMFVIGRVIIGFGNNLQQSASLVLLAEIAHPSQRPAVLGIMNTTGSVGQILAAWV
jgi:MFS family permease